MKPAFKSLILAGLLATAGLAAYAQPMMGEVSDSSGGHSMGMYRKMDPVKMEAAMAKRSAALKAKLKISAEQEGAWTAFTAAMKPTPSMFSKHPDAAEMAKLTTPERIDKMRAIHTQHVTEMTTAMDKRGDATKTFYATLTAEQKKVFDDEFTRMTERRNQNHGKGHHNAGK